MKRTAFRLATVYRIRRVQEDIEVGRLALARVHADQARRDEAAHLDAYRARSDREFAGSKVTSVNKFLVTRQSWDSLAGGATAARKRVIDSDFELADRVVDWRIAARRVSGLDRLYERHLEGRGKELIADQTRESDERTEQQRFRTPNPIQPRWTARLPPEVPIRSTDE